MVIIAVLHCIISEYSFMHLELYRNDRKYARREHYMNSIKFIRIAV